MDPQLVAAILGAGGTILAPVIAWKLATWSEQKQYSQVSRARTRLLANSIWKGQYVLAGKDPNNISFTFSVRRKKIQGRGSYKHRDGQPTEVSVSGGFVSERLLRLDYRNVDDHKLNFGTVLLEMNANAREMSGGILAYGRDPDQVYNGTIQLVTDG